MFDRNVWMKGRAITTAGLKTGIAYRMHYFVNLLSVPLTLTIYWYLWSAIFAASNTDIINGYTLDGMLSYYVIAMIVGFVTWSSVDEWIEEDVVHGYLVGALMRPMTYFFMMFNFTVGMNLLGILIELLPIILISSFFGVTLVQGWHILFFVMALCIAGILNFLLAYLTGLSAFWLQKITGMRRVRRVVTAFLAGSLIPLTFFPKNIQVIFSWLPFTHIRFTPVQIYLEQYSVTESLLMMSRGVIWIIIIYFLGKLVWHFAFKKFTGVGV